MRNKYKNYRLNNRGFTLLEILLVIAIIGILASVLMVGMGSQRQRARGAAALESIRSAMPFVAECYLKHNTIDGPNPGGGNSICGTGIDYPAIGTGSTLGCGYNAANDPITISCPGGITITCNYSGAGGVYCEL